MFYIISCQKHTEKLNIGYLVAEDEDCSIIITPWIKNLLKYQYFVEDFSYFVNTVEPSLMFLNLIFSVIRCQFQSLNPIGLHGLLVFEVTDGDFAVSVCLTAQVEIVF
jgi:hypothetical protein